MTDQNSFSGEQDPTARMNQQQQKARERAEDTANERGAGYRGTVETDDFDLNEALSNISEDE